MARLGGPTYDPATRARVRERIALLDRQGYPQAQIARIITEEFPPGVSAAQVNLYIKQIWQGYSKMDLRAKKRVLAVEKFLQYRDQFNEAQRAWEESKKDAEREVTEETPVRKCPMCRGTEVIVRFKTGEEVTCPRCDGEGEIGGIAKVTRSREGRAGDSRFLAIANDCLEAVRQLLGLDEDRKVQVGGSIGVGLNWDELFAEMPAKIPDTIQAEVVRAITLTEATLTEVQGTGNGAAQVASAPGPALPPPLLGMDTQAILDELKRRGLDVSGKPIPPLAPDVFNGDEDE